MRYLLLGIAILPLLAFVACGGGKSDSEKAADALNRGLQAHVAGDLVGAEAAYREVLTFEPQNKFAFYNLGLIAQTNGDSVSAENNYRLALAQDADFTSALFNLAIVRKGGGDLQGAIDLYRHVIAVDPNKAGGHLNLGYALLEQGNTAEGNAEIQKAREIDPSIPPPPTPTPAPSPAEGDGEATPEPTN